MGSAAVVLVHGFIGRAQNWDPLLNLLKNDPDVADRFAFYPWDYPTKLMELDFRRRIPNLSDLASALGGFIDSPGLKNREITLVGHSQGGLIIQQFLADMVEHGRGQELEQIRQVVLFATPHEGSVFLSGVRRMFFGLFRKNPQEKSLRVLAKDTAAAQRTVRERIANAGAAGPSEYPIAIRCFWGIQDNIVLRESAQGSYYEGSAIPGDHSTIIQPTGSSDARYMEFKEALLEPIGHPRIFEVEEFVQSISVKPLPPQTVVTCQYENNERTVQSDTKGIVQRKVRFSARNRCDEVFTLSYRTEEEGAIQANASHPNEASASDLVDYDNYGTAYVFKFRPQLGEEYSLQVVAYKAFDEGNQDVHLHLNKDSRYRRVIFELDLSRYLEAGHVLVKTPALHLRRTDPGDHSDCKAPATGDRVQAVETAPGIWRWEMGDLREGVVDLRWERALSPPPAAVIGGSGGNGPEPGA